RIALAKRAPIVAPALKVGRFHVKHTPVEKSTSLAWWALNELVHSRFEYMHGQLVRQRGGAGRRLAVDASFEAAVLPCEPEPVRRTVGANELAEHGETVA